MKIARAFPVFSAVFAIVYVVCMYWNLALFSYYPRTRAWYWLTVTDRPRADGPGMYWYGWLAVAFLAAGAVSALTLLTPPRVGERAWATSSWAAPAAMALVLVYILRGWFIH